MPTRNVFYSFHYEADNWRASQVRNMGVVEGNEPARDNDWEQVKRGGEASIKRWIDYQLNGRSCAIVLIGSYTSGRKWINYEIESAWNNGKGVFGIHIHNLKNQFGQQSARGSNPFSHFTMERDGSSLATIVKTYDPQGWDSQQVYSSISQNIAAWIKDAIKIRQEYGR